jgi:hypothetical protein
MSGAERFFRVQSSTFAHGFGSPAPVPRMGLGERPEWLERWGPGLRQPVASPEPDRTWTFAQLREQAWQSSWPPQG